jgi:2-oxoglutarate/2-oxoacid ferredoxin oxidoreductase subunit alpha
MSKDFTILIGGEAGQGTRLAGNIIATLFQKMGYFVYVYEDYQSLIRGGHNFSEIRVSHEKKIARKEKIDALIALDRNTISLHKKRLSDDGLVIFNADRIKGEEGIPVFSEKIVKEEGGIPQMVNVTLISALAKSFGIDFGILEKVLRERIKRSIDLNLKIAKRSFDEVENKKEIVPLKDNNTILLTGNEATGLGLVKAGLDFYFAYPMTPTTSLLNFLAQRQKELGVKVFQPESEITVINMALGSAFVGKRSAVGSSGGGFALMVESVSLAAQAEIPILIVEGQRAGPSTGMPTYNLQGDLFFVLGAGHGDIQKFVLHPGEAEDALYLANLGLNLAWKYQVPVILLVDKDIAENTFPVDKKVFDTLKKEEPKLFKGEGEYLRYKITEDGISPLAFPGSEYIVKVTSYEHDEKGVTTEDETMASQMQEKRKRKFDKMIEEVRKIGGVRIYGERNAKIAIIPFGICKGVAIEIAKEFGFKVIFPYFFQPFPEEAVKDELRGVEKIYTLELNSTGQLATYLKMYGIEAEPVLKYTGRPFIFEELKEKFQKL